MRRLLILVAVFMIAGGVANADWVGLANGSFETANPGASGIIYGKSIPEGSGQWDVYTENGDIAGWIPGSEGIELQNIFASAGGTQHIELDTHGFAPNEYFGHNSTASQTFTVDPGDEGEFLLNFSYRIRPERSTWSPGLPDITTYDATSGLNLSTFAIGVYLDGTRILTIDSGEAAWTVKMSEFSLFSGSHTLTFAALGWADSYGGLIDLVSLERLGGETPVPEPATFLLMGSGLIGVFLLGRRRRSTGRPD